MNYTTITAVALAVLVVGAGAVAAIPGQAADQAQGHTNDNASDGGAEHSGDAGQSANEGTAGDAGTNASDDASERRGPPVDMPGQVPDHVSQIHQTIADWLDGDRDGSLGDRISDIVGGDDAADETNEK